MHLKLPLTVLLSAGSAWAAAEDCFSSSAGDTAGYDACCPSKDTSGKGTVGSSVFQFSCAHFARSSAGFGMESRGVTSARECAALCDSDSNCEVASWGSSRSLCYLLNTKAITRFPTDKWLLLRKTKDQPEEPAANCEEQVNAAKEECQRECEEDCNDKILTAVNDAKAQCQKDKDALLAGEKTKCDAQLATQAQKCADEKAALIASWDAEKAKLEAEKKTCQSELDALKGTVKPKPGPGEPGPGTGTTIPSEFGSVTRGNLCPSYNGKEFETANPDGGRSKWRVNCNMMLNHGAWRPDKLHVCQSTSVVENLKFGQQDLRSSYKGLWIRSDGWCNHVHAGLVVPLVTAVDYSGNHHYVEKIS